jgi:hypothetical protein
MLLACCKAVPGAAASLAGEQGVLILTALLCTHHRMLQQVGAVPLECCHTCAKSSAWRVMP